MKSRLFGALLTALMLVITLFTYSPQRASAQEGMGIYFGVGPKNAGQGYFKFVLKPGESAKDIVLLMNNSEQAKLNLNIVKRTGETGLTGGITFDDKVDGTAEWIDFPGEGNYDVNPKEGVPLDFTVTVPKNTPPGEYIAGFLVGNNADVAGDPTQLTPVPGTGGNTGGLAVQVVPKAATTVWIIVDDPKNCEIKVSPVKTELEEMYGRMKTTITMKATGNLHYKGTGKYALVPLNADGSDREPFYSRDFDVDWFIPGDKIDYPIYIDGDIPPAGKYRVDLSFSGDCKIDLDNNTQVKLKEKEVNNTKEQAEQMEKPQPNLPPGAIVLDQKTLLIAGGVLLVLILLALLVFWLLRRKGQKQ